MTLYYCGCVTFRGKNALDRVYKPWEVKIVIAMVAGMEIPSNGSLLTNRILGSLVPHAPFYNPLCTGNEEEKGSIELRALVLY